jgi:hypothetical protein
MQARLNFCDDATSPELIYSHNLKKIEFPTHDTSPLMSEADSDHCRK